MASAMQMTQIMRSQHRSHVLGQGAALFVVVASIAGLLLMGTVLFTSGLPLELGVIGVTFLLVAALLALMTFRKMREPD